MAFAHVTYGGRLSEINLFSIKGRLLRADLIMIWKILNGHCQHLSCLFASSVYRRTRGQTNKIFLPHHATVVQTRFFSIRVVGLRNSLPEEAVSALTLAAFKREI